MARATKNELQDTVSVTMVAKKQIRSERLFCEAVNAALPNLGQWEYQDRQETHGWWEAELHPKFSASTDLVPQARAWVADTIPLLNAQGLRVISASVDLQRNKLAGDKTFESIFSTHEHAKLVWKAEQSVNEVRFAEWLQLPMQSHEIKVLGRDLRRAVEQGLITFGDDMVVKEVSTEDDGVHTTLVLKI